jgi:hypothetical protein
MGNVAGLGWGDRGEERSKDKTKSRGDKLLHGAFHFFVLLFSGILLDRYGDDGGQLSHPRFSPQKRVPHPSLFSSGRWESAVRFADGLSSCI